MPATVASQITYAEVTTAASLEVTDGSILVHGFHVTNTGGANHEFNVTDKDGTVIMSLLMRSTRTEVFNIPFLADNGLVFGTPNAGSYHVTVYHSSEGA